MVPSFISFLISFGIRPVIRLFFLSKTPFVLVINTNFSAFKTSANFEATTSALIL